MVLHVSSGEGDVLSLPTATIPLSHEEEGDRPVDGSVTARVFHQRRRAEDAHVDEVTGEAAAAAMAAAEDDVEPSPAVHVFHGHARWSRVQLMNEIARGAWGAVSRRAGGFNRSMARGRRGVLASSHRFLQACVLPNERR